MAIATTKSTATEPSCSASVSTDGYGSHDCYRRGVIERDGKHYCKQHDPVAVDAKRKAEEQKWEADRRARDARVASTRVSQAKATAFDQVLAEYAQRLEWAEPGHDTSAEFGRRVTAIIVEHLRTKSPEPQALERRRP